MHGPVVDQILADEQIGGTLLWPLTDDLGTVRDLVNSSATVQNHLKYDSYGKVTSESNAAVDHLFAFTGRERDEETGLQYHRARYLDVAVGRWMSEDPIGFMAGDASSTRYVSNQPTIGIDQNGLWQIQPGTQFSSKPSTPKPPPPTIGRHSIHNSDQMRLDYYRRMMREIIIVMKTQNGQTPPNGSNYSYLPNVVSVTPYAKAPRYALSQKNHDELLESIQFTLDKYKDISRIGSTELGDPFKLTIGSDEITSFYQWFGPVLNGGEFRGDRGLQAAIETIIHETNHSTARFGLAWEDYLPGSVNHAMPESDQDISMMLRSFKNVWRWMAGNQNPVTKRSILDDVILNSKPEAGQVTKP